MEDEHAGATLPSRVELAQPVGVSPSDSAASQTDLGKVLIIGNPGPEHVGNHLLRALLLALHVLHRYIDTTEIRAITFAAALLSFLCPMYYIEGGLVWIFPLPLQPFV